MPEYAGKDTVIKISGAALSLTGEPTTSVAGNLIYQITDATKQVLDREAVISVQKKGTDDAAEAGTTTTNLKMTAHGLVTGDLIVNTTRSNAVRSVTKVDNDNLTVAAVTGQTTGDTIEVYKTEAESAYSLNRLNGKITYPTATVRVIRITGSYLPMTVAAYAHSMSRNKTAAMLNKTVFGDTHQKRKAGMKSASGTFSHFDVADTTYTLALAAGVPVVIEDRDAAASEPNRFWALLSSEEVKSAANGMQDVTVSWESYDAWIKLGG